MKRLFALTCLLLPLHQSGATEPDPLFQSDETLELVIHGPFANLMQERNDEEEAAGTVTLVGADGTDETFDVQLRSRGNFRRKPEVCEFSPLRINFRKSDVTGTIFDNQDKLKLVTHCQAREMSYKHAIVREYMAYRLFNLFTDKSFRVRMLKVRYVDTAAKRRDETELAFFIESTERLAARLNRPEYQTDRVPLAQLDAEHLQLTSLFQYLIGNTDFSPIASIDASSCCHNYRLFGDPETGLYSIPYDFDMSGLVNAQYAVPNSRFKLRSVTQRLYRGRCEHNALVPTSIERFQAQRTAIFELLEAQEDMSKTAKKTTRKFFENFYKLIENPKRVEGRMIGDCV